MAAEEAVEALFGWTRVGGGDGELIEVSLKRGEKWIPKFTDLDSLLVEGLPVLRDLSAGGMDVYVGAVTLREEPERGRGKAGLRARAGAVWVDLDCEAPGREGEMYFRSVGEALEVWWETLHRVGLDDGARITVESGWGVQGWLLLDEPVGAGVASKWTRALCEAVRETASGMAGVGERHVDRVWDVTRVLRFPADGLFNWRGGPGMEQPVRVVEYGTETGDKKRLGLAAVETALSGYAVVPVLGGSGGGGWSGVPVGESGALMDVDAAFAGVEWAAILEPFGWTRIGGGGEGGEGEAEVWSRPGGEGRRSAVVYADAPGVLVVHSDAPETGLPAWWETGENGVLSNTKARTWERLSGGSAFPAAVEARMREDEQIARTWLESMDRGRRASALSWYEQNKDWLE